MLDQLRQIAIFSKTIDHGSFRGAARELQLSPSVVSHHISQLEEHLGVSLIHRSTRKLALTHEGQRLLASTQQMLEAVEGVFLELANSASSPSGELRITTPSVLIRSQLNDSIAAFSMKYENVKLSLDYNDSRRDIIEEGYDVAIRATVNTKIPSVARKLFKVERRLIASKSYLKSRGKVTRPEQLVDWHWVELEPVKHIKQTFRKSKAKPVSIKPKAHITANDVLAVSRLVHAGAGLAIAPEFMAEEGISAGTVDYVLPDWKLAPIDIFATWPSNAPRHGLIKLFVDEISGRGSLR